ncbi:fatty acid desaturase family protein [Streptomyces sp. NPDC054796]
MTGPGKSTIVLLCTCSETAAERLSFDAGPGDQLKSKTVWRNSPLDAVLVALSLAQFGATIILAASWGGAGTAARIGSFALLVFMMTYNIIIISHLFTHQPWFRSQALNGAVSMMNSASIAQSVQEYELSHVRNHHRYNNDRQAADGTTKDTSSTYRDGRDGEHAGLLRYIVGGALDSMLSLATALLSVTRLFRVGPHESALRYASRSPGPRGVELRQVRLDRLAHFAFVCLLGVLSWQWLLMCYLPAVFLGLALVNVQNYYRHFGAEPDSRYANSVSHYGRVYNFLTFNDGYHQEHHLRPPTHWSRLPDVRSRYRTELDSVDRVISPVPAILGFLDTGRAQGNPKKTTVTGADR